jgi:glucose-6-phosphate isomerase
MDKDGNTWGEYMDPESLHYIDGGVAHRVANTGSRQLVFGACWHSDAGHDYKTIEKNGFSARLINDQREPIFVKNI